MNKNKSLYEAPNTDLLVVRFEQNIMSDPIGYHSGGAGRYVGDDIYDNGDY